MSELDIRFAMTSTIFDNVLELLSVDHDVTDSTLQANVHEIISKYIESHDVGNMLVSLISNEIVSLYINSK